MMLKVWFFPKSAPKLLKICCQDRGLTEDEVRAYLLHRVTPQRLELEASMEVLEKIRQDFDGQSI